MVHYNSVCNSFVMIPLCVKFVSESNQISNTDHLARTASEKIEEGAVLLVVQYALLLVINRWHIYDDVTLMALRNKHPSKTATLLMCCQIL